MVQFDMTYPISFRQHVLSARGKEGLTFEETSERFCIGVASLKRWSKRITPKPYERKKVRKLDPEKPAQDVLDHPDAYQYERAARFGVTQKSIWQALRKLGLTQKKVMRHPKGNADARRVFCEKITQYEEDGRSIVYIDESGFAHDMPRTHGYAPKGERCHGSHDWQARGRINVIGALLAGVLPSVGLTEANVDADIFNLWLIGDLLPKLPPRVVLVMDRATFHRRADTQAAVAQAGHTLEYLPACSPDFNKIEHKWAEAKACRRKTGMSVDEIFENRNWNQN